MLFSSNLCLLITPRFVFFLSYTLIRQVWQPFVFPLILLEAPVVDFNGLTVVRGLHSTPSRNVLHTHFSRGGISRALSIPASAVLLSSIGLSSGAFSVYRAKEFFFFFLQCVSFIEDLHKLCRRSTPASTQAQRRNEHVTIRSGSCSLLYHFVFKIVTEKLAVGSFVGIFVVKPYIGTFEGCKGLAIIARRPGIAPSSSESDYIA